MNARNLIRGDMAEREVKRFSAFGRIREAGLFVFFIFALIVLSLAECWNNMMRKILVRG